MEEKNVWTKDKVEHYVKKMEQISQWVYEPFAREIVNYIEEHKLDDRLTVLDLGCGPGFLSFEIKKVKSHYTIVGIDPTEYMLEIAKKKAVKWGVEDFDVKIGNAENIPLPEKSVDVVVSQSNLFVWRDIKKGLREIYRILREGGLLIVRDSNRDYPKEKLDQFYDIMVKTCGEETAKSHFRTYDQWRTMSEVKQLLVEEKFIIEDAKGGPLYTIVGRK